MSSVWPSILSANAGLPAAGTALETSLSTLVYRSRCVVPLSEADLDRLLIAAQARNHWESVTGVLIHDQGHIFQWLEGPAAGLARIWQSIVADPRHTDIEVVCHMATQARSFAGWDMKLAQRQSPLPGQAASEHPDAVLVSDNVVEALYRHPAEAPALLASLATRRAAIGPVSSQSIRSARAIVMELFTSVGLPHLLSEGAFAQASVPPTHPRVGELAELLMAPDPSAAVELIMSLQAAADSMAALFATVVEPAARELGDLWGIDDCTEDGMTIGLSRLQTAVRRLGCGVPELLPAQAPVRAVLVATQPGEQHRLACTLDAEVLWQAGWDTRCEFPASDEALQSLLSNTWFDALDLSLSLSVRREHWLPRMADTIARARAASRNPALVVVAGGRVFVEQGDAGLRVGADATSVSAMQIGSLLVGALPVVRPAAVASPIAAYLPSPLA